MEFKDKFKPGDIICSDRFHNGLCMIVEEGYVCTCPGGGELALQHIEELERFINERIIKQS